MVCETQYSSGGRHSVIHQFCGSDGKSYTRCELEYEMETPYGKSVNLQLKHQFACFSWEAYKIDILLFFIVSKFQIFSFVLILD